MKRNYAPIKDKSEWTWRTNPRTVSRMIERLKTFKEFEGQKDTHKLRKEYSKKVIFNTQERGKEDESQFRQDKVTFELFGLGYIDKEKKIRVTEVGNLFIDEEQADIREETFIKQMLKYQIPNPNQKGKSLEKVKIFPFKLILDLLFNLEYLNMYEIALVCFNTQTNSSEDLENAIKIITEFRKCLPKGEIKKNVVSVYEELYKKNWKNAKPSTPLGKVRAFCTSLEYTGLLKLSGRGNFTKLRISDFFKKKAEELKNFEFEFNPNFKSIELFLEKHGSTKFPELPWDNKDKLKEILRDKLTKSEEKEVQQIKVEDYDTITELKKIEIEIDKSLLNQYKNKYINEISKTQEERLYLINQLNQISTDSSGINNPALKLENLIWKSLIALNGESHTVKENFKTNPDLSIKNYAPGRGNTPDIEFYNGEFVFIIEVTLTENISQYRAEGMSVLEHVEKFVRIQYGDKLNKFEKESIRGSLIKESDSRKIYGLFIAPKLDIRTLKQFYTAGKFPILKKEVPVVPLELDNYLKILGYCYKNNLSAYNFEKLINQIGEEIQNTKNWEEWMKKRDLLIETFLKKKKEIKYKS